MARQSIIRSDSIDYSFWLIFSADGQMRFTRGEPTANRGERKMKCSAVLPKSLFKTPELKATISVGDVGAHTFNIDVNAVSEALRATIGCDIDLRVERPDE